MARKYSSFLVRCWQLNGGERRFEIEHIQSGERTSVVTLGAAVDWMRSYADDLAQTQPPMLELGEPESLSDR